MKAAAPIIGGVICPPEEEQASTAAENLGLYPILFIKGIVKAPVVATFATADPEIVPRNALATTDALAGPPRRCPVREIARSKKNFPAPERTSMAPKMMNNTI
jgi:hypothetical protein